MIRVTSNLKKFLASMRDITRETREQTERNIKDACAEMVLRAKETTPPLNGEDRGKNTVTGDLAASWKYEYKLEDGTWKVTIKNDVQYASYVNNGHIMKEHFVPWLFIDGMGVLARHIPEPGEPLFGLTVGTQTEKVEGYNMVEKAKDRFFEAYRALHEDSVRRAKERMKNADKH